MNIRSVLQRLRQAIHEALEDERIALTEIQDNLREHKVYKQCERLRRRLWRLLKMAWRKNFFADDWLVVEGCFVPKEENSTDISQFHALSLLRRFLEF